MELVLHWSPQRFESSFGPIDSIRTRQYFDRAHVIITTPRAEYTFVAYNPTSAGMWYLNPCKSWHYLAGQLHTLTSMDVSLASYDH